MKTTKLLLIVVGLLTVVRMGLVLFEDPSPAETYYYLCAEKPAPAYFDGPAGTARLIGWLEAVGLPEGGWRLQAPLWALAATGACFLLLRQVGNAEKAAWAGLALNALPVFNVAALRVGPGLPALTATTLTMWLAWRAFHAESGRLLWWLAAGLMMAVATSFAYAAVAWIPALLIFTLASPKHRRVDEIIGLGLLILFPALILGPALAWNANLEWLPIASGTLRTLWMFAGWGFLLSSWELVKMFSPFVLGLMFLAWAVAGRESVRRLSARFLFLGALPGIVLSGYFALRGESAVLYLLLASPLLLFGIVMGDFRSRWRRTIAGLTFTVAIAMAVWTVPGVITSGEGWRATAAEVRNAFLKQSAQGDGIFLVAGDPALASVLGYHLRNDLVPPPGHPTVYVGESQDVSNQFGLWAGYGDFITSGHTADEYFTEQDGENPFLGRNALYITHEDEADLPQTIRAAFTSVIRLETLPAAGGNTEPLYIYQCLDYQTQPL